MPFAETLDELEPASLCGFDPSSQAFRPQPRNNNNVRDHSIGLGTLENGPRASGVIGEFFRNCTTGRRRRMGESMWDQGIAACVLG